MWQRLEDLMRLNQINYNCIYDSKSPKLPHGTAETLANMSLGRTTQNQGADRPNFLPEISLISQPQVLSKSGNAA